MDGTREYLFTSLTLTLPMFNDSIQVCSASLLMMSEHQHSREQKESLDPLLARQKETLSKLQTQLEATQENIPTAAAAAAAENQSSNLSIESLSAASDSITAFAERYSRTLSGATSDADPPLHQRLFHPLLQGKEPFVTTPHLDEAVVSAHESIRRFQQAIDDFRSVKRSVASLSEIPPTSESATLLRLHQIKSEVDELNKACN
ncbi:hypothetical protein BJ741DRAFT_220737 [Chytriomyces cf. hyalinus JEL632]|nr:hypothetical protein BJ741DRAFT_220737 [Chytriomyces cf. hyalinus JEL632]